MARSMKGERKRHTRGGSRSMSTVTPMWRPYRMAVAAPTMPIQIMR